VEQVGQGRARRLRGASQEFFADSSVLSHNYGMKVCDTHVILGRSLSLAHWTCKFVIDRELFR
jgi:hypothetical protein